MLGAVLSGSLNIILSVPLSGSEIVKLVEDMQRQPGTVYFAKAQDPQHPERILLGQASDEAPGNFLVTDPDSSVDGILPDTEYERLVVRSYNWPHVDARTVPNQSAMTLECLWQYGRRLDTMIEHPLRQAVS